MKWCIRRGSWRRGRRAAHSVDPAAVGQRNALSDSLIRYLEFHTESTLNIRSLKVLRELFAHL